MSAARELIAMQTGIRGCAYVIDADHGVKIGVTRWAYPEERTNDIASIAGMPMRILRAWRFSDYATACAVEKAAHRALQVDRTMGEWFHCHPLEACETVERLTRDLARQRERAA